MAKKTTSAGATLVRLQDLTGGVDLRRSPTLLPPTRSQRLENFCLEEAGALKVVPGYVAWGDALSADIQGMQRVYLDTGVITLVASNGEVTVVADDGSWTAPATSGLDTSALVSFVNDRTLVAALDGVTAPPPKSTDGTTWTNLGIAAPAAAPTVVTAPGGSLVSGSTYEVSYSGKDDELAHEGNESAVATAVPTTPNLSLTVTLPYHPDDQVDTLCVYARDVTAGESVRRRVGTVANPGSGTATYTITSNSWSAGVEAPTDHEVPGALAFGVVWKNRWWARDATVLNRIRFTQIFQPQSWPTLFYLDIPFTRGDAIQAMVPLGDTLVIFGDTGVYQLLGQTSLDFEVRPSAGALAGALGRRSACAIEQGIVHAAAAGIYLFDGASDRLLTYPIDPGWRHAVSNGTAAEHARLAVVYHEARKEIRVSVADLYPNLTPGEWVLDLNRTRLQEEPAWYATTRSIGGYVSWDGAEVVTGSRGRLFAWPRSGGQLTEEATGTSWNGSPIVAVYTGPALSTGLPWARFIDLYGEYAPAAGTFGVQVDVDGELVMTESFTPGAAISIYGTAEYGTGEYGALTRLTWQSMLPLEAEGRSVTLTGQYTGAEEFIWYGYAVGIVPEAMPRGF